jgi:hypothetical protein
LSADVKPNAEPDADGSRVITPAEIDALNGRSRLLRGASLWPTQPVRVHRFWWRWTVAAHPTGKVVAQGHAFFERWAWHAAGRAAAQIYNAKHKPQKAEAEK